MSGKTLIRVLVALAVVAALALVLHFKSAPESTAAPDSAGQTTAQVNDKQPSITQPAVNTAEKTGESAPSADDAGEAVAAAQDAKLPSLIDLGSDTCIPCRQMIPVLASLKKGFAGKLNVQFINIHENEQAAKDYKIKLIPTQVFLDPEGKELYRHVGFISEDDILSRWRELGYDFPSAGKDADTASSPADAAAGTSSGKQEDNGDHKGSG